MKAKPIRFVDGTMIECSVAEATHIRLNLPCPISDRIIPISLTDDITSSPCWFWNGSTDRPTLQPSLLTRSPGSKMNICHSFIVEGEVKFLEDSTHDNAGKTLPLLEVD
jgi:hypothetical protein